MAQYFPIKNLFDYKIEINFGELKKPYICTSFLKNTIIDIFKIGFLAVTIWDIFDILIVGYLLYHLLRLIRGSIAFNILIGIVLLYGLWWLVAFLKMEALSLILGQFARLGVIAVLIVFQPEIRRFLLLLGKTLNQRYYSLTEIFRRDLSLNADAEEMIRQLLRILPVFAASHTGALIVFTKNPDLQVFNQSGVRLNARLTSQLLESLFNKESPLHDGAVIVADSEIFCASCVLPVSESHDLPEGVGTRHRAAVGITEGTDMFAIVVSEETGRISYARDGMLTTDVSSERIAKVLRIILETQV